ncbi:MAG TPA: biotin/lipoyl-binding protein, partial [Marinobacter sp.]|nr:biotin/lipoyl-binding protein [Marinobacter sp.]
MWKQWLIALVFAVVAAGAAVFYQSLDSEEQTQDNYAQPATVVNTISPELDTVRDVVKAVGSLKAKHSVEITTEVSGRVVALNLKSGHQVNQRDVLVQLDDRQVRADLQVIDAQL